MLEANPSNTDSSEDSFLLKQIEQGCKNSFNILYDKYWEWGYTEAYKRLKNSDKAKDVVQEIFIHIWLKKETLHIDNLHAYLHTAIRNKVFKVLAKEKLSHPFFDILNDISQVSPEADAHVLTKEFLRSYDALVKTLPLKKQLIFRLHFHEDLSTKEIAQQLGLSRKTVQNQLARAIHHLKISLILLIALLPSM